MRVIVIADTTSLIEIISSLRRPLCLVPTMGALHEGHLSLIRAARKKVGPTGTVAVSIFVNPIQFDRKDDLEKYPRPLETDLAACEAEGADLVFTPDAGSMYEADHSVTISENRLSTTLCGATRPGHFTGVCTVVMKLFMLFQAESAVFGKKDFQQLAIIRRMVRDLNVPIEIVGHPTIRETDGLAMSSRNVRLSIGHRAEAPSLHRAISAAANLFHQGERQTAALLHEVRRHLSDAPSFELDYLTIVESDTLSPVTFVQKASILAIAGFLGEVRLIDHIELQPFMLD